MRNPTRAELHMHHLVTSEEEEVSAVWKETKIPKGRTFFKR